MSAAGLAARATCQRRRGRRTASSSWYWRKDERRSTAAIARSSRLPRTARSHPGTQRTILKRTQWAGDIEAPAISADGRTVVYTHANSWLTKPAGAASLYTVGIDGSANRRITPWKLGGGDHPTFSPTGSILFRSYEDQETRQSQFMTVEPDGTGLRQLTHLKDGTPVLSASIFGRWALDRLRRWRGRRERGPVRDARGRHRQPPTDAYQRMGQRA